MRLRTWTSLLSILVVSAGLLFSAAAPAHAQSSVSPEPAGTCTDAPEFSPTLPEGTPGLITKIADNVTSTLDGMAEGLFRSISDASDYQYAIGAALTLYIAIYGMFFAVGLVQTSVHDFSMRALKIAVIAILINGDAWELFHTYVVTFFDTATNEIICEVSSIPLEWMGGVDIDANCTPLRLLDQAVAKVISANMAVHIIATFTTSVYGFLYGILLVIGLWSFGSSLLTGIWVYLLSLVLRTLLFGLAPIFLACLLFDRTKHLFLGWLNQVVNACLQPILLFTFFSFFVLLILNTIETILVIPVCWTESSESLRGTPFSPHMWRYTAETDTPNEASIGVDTPDGTRYFDPYGGLWDLTGASGISGSPIFPIDILAVLVMFILAELGQRFNQVVLMIARDLSAGSVNLAGFGGGFSELFSPGAGSQATAPSGSAPSSTVQATRDSISGLSNPRR